MEQEAANQKALELLKRVGLSDKKMFIQINYRVGKNSVLLLLEHYV